MRQNHLLADFGVELHKGKLDNGLKVIFIEKPFAPIYARMLIRAGSTFDPSHLPGLAHFTEHILAAGSKSCFKEDFWGIMESVGGFRNASTSSTWMDVKCEIAEVAHMQKMKQHFTHALCTINATESAIEKEKGTIISEIHRRYSKLEEFERDFVNAFFANGTAWYHNSIGTIESVSRTQASDVETFFTTHCCVENMVLVIAGGCTWNHVQKTFSSIPFLNGSEQVLPEDPAFLQTPQQIHFEQNTSETRLRFAFKGPQCDSSDNYLLRFAMAMAHDGLTSLFYRRIRNEKNLAYALNMFNCNFVTNGYFGTYVGVPCDKVGKTIAAIKDCYEELLTEGINETEILSKNETSWFTAKRTMETSFQWVQELSRHALYPEHQTSFGDYPAIFNYLETFTSEQINDVLKKYIDLENMIFISCGKE